MVFKEIAGKVGLGLILHLDVYSLDDTGDDVEHLHFCITFRHLLQQLEEQPKDGLEVLNREIGKSAC